MSSVATAAGVAPKRVALYLGSAAGDSPAYRDITVAVVRHLAEHGHSLVYGGGSVGLMGVAADTALAAGMDVHGVITRHLYDGETERDSNVLEVHVNHLRRKLGRSVIETRRGQGYRFGASPA